MIFEYGTLQDPRRLSLLEPDGKIAHVLPIHSWRETARALFSVELLSLFPQRAETRNWQPEEPNFTLTLNAVKHLSNMVIDAAFADAKVREQILAYLYPTELSAIVAREDWPSVLLQLGTIRPIPAPPAGERPFLAALLLYALGYLEAFVAELRAHLEYTLRNDVYQSPAIEAARKREYLEYPNVL